MSSKSPFALDLWDIHVPIFFFCVCFLTFWLISYLPKPWNQSFLITLFPLVGNGIRDEDLSARYLFFQTLSADKLGKICVYIYNMHVQMHILLHTYCMHIDVHAHILEIVNFDFCCKFQSVLTDIFLTYSHYIFICTFSTVRMLIPININTFTLLFILTMQLK